MNASDLIGPDLAQGFLDSLVVVLMRTTHPGNIGAAARACKTMGLSQLRLVEPGEFPCEEATRRASGASDILERSQVFSSLDDAVADCHLVVGASARSRKMQWPLMNPRDCANELLSVFASEVSKGARPRFALLFGQEASGLSNDELQRCNYHVNIPANAEYASLNLAMAVQVLAYECRMCALVSSEDDVLKVVGTQNGEQWDEVLASNAELEGMIAHLEKTMVEVGYHDPANPRMLVPRLRRLFQRAKLDTMEINILRGFYKSVQKAIGHKSP